MFLTVLIIIKSRRTIQGKTITLGNPYVRILNVRTGGPSSV